MKLYEITQYINEMEDETDEQMKQDMIETLTQELQEKNTNIIKVVRNFETNIMIIEDEIKRLQELKRRKNNNIKSLKKYVLAALDSIGMKKVETPLGTVSVRNSKKVVIEDINKLPAEFVEIKQTLRADKKLIKEKLKVGKVAGAHIEECKNLQIK